MNVGAIIVAGGSGLRMGAEVPKQFLRVGGECILVRTLRALLPWAAECVVVLPASEQERWRAIATEAGLWGSHKVVTGGKTRFQSVRNGLEAVSADCELVAVHDGVRPLVSEAMIKRSVECAERYGSAIPTIAAVDSFRIERGGTLEVIDRSRLRAVQTPQVFDAELLRRAYEQPEDVAFTDDGSVVEMLGVELHFYEGERRNIKITSPEDLAIAEALLGV